MRQSETRTGYSLNKWKTIILKDKDEAIGSTTPDRRTVNNVQGIKKGGRLVLYMIHGRDSRGSVLQTYLSVGENTAT